MGLQAQALEVSLAPSVRTYPQSASAEISVKEEWLIWNEKSEDLPWYFGFLQAKAVVASHGMIEGQLSVFPISFIEIGYSVSQTSRFYETKTFNCDRVICRGNVLREKSFVRLAWAYKDWVFIPSSYRKRISNSDKSKFLADEVEHLLAWPGGDDLDVSTFIVGKNIGKNFLALVHREAQYYLSDKRNEAQYLVYRTRWRGASFSGGAGRYFSSYADPQLSVVAALTWSWGDSMSLF